MASVAKEELFERTPIPKAVASLSIPTIISSLVMVIYSMVDTYFVGLLNEPVQTAAVALAAGPAGLQRGQQPVRRGQLQHDEPGHGLQGF